MEMNDGHKSFLSAEVENIAVLLSGNKPLHLGKTGGFFFFFFLDVKSS